MKLIIWWLALMTILPLLYLFWWKKRWRLLIGVIILAILVISFFAPNEVAYSILNRELEKELKKPQQELEIALKNLPENVDYNSSEKLKLENSIVSWQEEIEKFKESLNKKEGEEKKQSEALLRGFELNLWIAKRKWIRNWGSKKVSILLFGGEEFNQALNREKEWWGNLKHRIVENYRIIDFKKVDKIDLLKEKLQKICQQNEDNYSLDLPIVWLKNIDRITDPKIKKELVKIVDPEKKSNLGEYYQEIKKKDKTQRTKKIVDLSQFTLVATTSVANSKLPSELRAKLKPIEPFFDKYFWTIFGFSAGLEIIILFLLIWSHRKEKKKSLKQFNY